MRTWTMRTLIAVMFAGVISSAAWADNNGLGPRCSESTLKGEYVFTATGFNIVGGVAQPKAIVELIDFYGDGALNVTGGTVSINGVVTQIAPNGAGNYILGPDCNGSLSFVSAPLTFSIFIERDGKSGWIMQTNPNSVFQGTLTQRK